VCPDCGRPFNPELIHFIEVKVCTREEAQEVERLNRGNSYE
jgi:hypothetical protein